MNSLWDIRIFLGLVPMESPCIWHDFTAVMHHVVVLRLMTECGGWMPMFRRNILLSSSGLLAVCPFETPVNTYHTRTRKALRHSPCFRISDLEARQGPKCYVTSLLQKHAVGSPRLRSSTGEFNQWQTVNLHETFGQVCLRKRRYLFIKKAVGTRTR
jgi:hypothetical protein